MNDIGQLYVSQMHDRVGFFATWPLNQEIKIGHYGPMKGKLFQPFAQLRGLVAQEAPGKATHDYTISADRLLNAQAKALADAGVTQGNALLEVHFHSEAAVTFSAPESVVTRVSDIKALGERLVEMLHGESWNRKHGIVVEVTTAPMATIIASEKAGAEVKFEVAANTPVSPQVMANLDEETQLRTYRGVGAKSIGKGPVTPLFRLAFLKRRFLRDPEIVVRGPAGEEVKPSEVVEVGEDETMEVY
jgi:hypothetical protein